MGSPTFSRREKTIQEPDRVSNSQLLQTSLHNLAQTLPRTTSARATFSIYFRWLEVHRKHPSRLSEHWDNTLMHWAQSLKQRGFNKSDVVNELQRWTESQPASIFKDSNGRIPPNSRDIDTAFENTKPSHHRQERSARDTGDSWRPNDGRGLSVASGWASRKNPSADFSGPPPKNYICNRCSKPGHHLQACPTNLDPAYDRPPESHYKCEVCHARGEHFKSLCPKNQDPFSIIMKRKALGIKTPPVKSKSRTVNPRDKDSPTGRHSRDLFSRETTLFTEDREASLDKSPVKTNRARLTQKLQEIDNRKTQLSMEDVYDFHYLLEAAVPENKCSINDNKKRGRVSDSSESCASSREDDTTTVDDLQSIKRLRLDIPFTNDKEEVVMSDHLFDTSAELSSHGDEVVKDQMIMNECANKESQELPMRSAKSVHMPQFASWSNLEEIELSANEVDSSDEMDVDEISCKPIKVYSELVQNLIQHFPKMSEEVNEVKRSTALDMWKNDVQRVELVPMSHHSPTWSAFSSDVKGDSFAEHLSNGQPRMIAQYDGAGDDGTPRLPRVNRMVSAKGKKATDNVSTEAGSSQTPFGSPPFRLTSLTMETDEVKIAGAAGSDGQAAYDPRSDSPTEAFPSFVDAMPPPVTIAGIIARGAMHQAGRTSISGAARELHPSASVDDLKNFAQNFKLTTPVPKDIASLVGKGATKPKLELQKSKSDVQHAGDNEKNKRFGENNELCPQTRQPVTLEFPDTIMIDDMRGLIPPGNPFQRPARHED